MTGTKRGCLACGGNGCGRNKLTMKEFDTAEQLAIKLKPQHKFLGEQDERSGTTWLEEMERKTEGHPEVIKYLWLKHHSEPRVWDRVTNKQVCPTHCYESYAYCLRIIKGRYRQKYDTDEHLQKAESQFNRCIQGRDSVPEFVDRLEILANELCHLGAAPLEYTLKWRLFTGLSNDKVRDKVDNYVAKSSYSYERFRNKVLSQAQRVEQLGKVSYRDSRSSAKIYMVSNVKDYVKNDEGDSRLVDLGVPMVIGEVKLQGKPTTALFDTGAEASLITYSWLEEYAPKVQYEDIIIPRITTADGSGMAILGSVMLTVATNNIEIVDRFIVTSDDLSVPLLLGCTTLSKLKTSIVITTNGMNIVTNVVDVPKIQKKGELLE
ncbi:hypothetical protein Pmar_PMAR006765 [Perkinsus marinus ATCC 50983]|uniref:Retropepsins domain-containing protein n=1 Tax=Perkinsus marinus (strain ATCC 50983 / TXsc) TaxID=423536 RepID=C5K6F3_PERM5|nr:hypothetical protein Pmar_PMAR006765 [Perkinsus marinus ATCC 50983]EER19873.1 hypothetical protein Pmar_PMAR006765 [Perkinsus marinus ATCC 50983]|eukprot:XP_002788077.1 hypothetical protein Pmar_PMAR006765 [Perkinsus marinus ATCC 50983]